MTGVSANIAPLMVGMDGEVETHQLCEGGVLVAQHGGEVSRPVLLGIYAANLIKRVWKMY